MTIATPEKAAKHAKVIQLAATAVRQLRTNTKLWREIIAQVRNTVREQGLAWGRSYAYFGPHTARISFEYIQKPLTWKRRMKAAYPGVEIVFQESWSGNWNTIHIYFVRERKPAE